MAKFNVYKTVKYVLQVNADSAQDAIEQAMEAEFEEYDFVSAEGEVVEEVDE